MVCKWDHFHTKIFTYLKMGPILRERNLYLFKLVLISKIKTVTHPYLQDKDGLKYNQIFSNISMLRNLSAIKTKICQP